MPTVADVAAWIAQQYPPALAESWDAVGLVAGRPEAQVRRILVTVDVTEAVARQAITGKFDLILAHHPLMLSGVTSIAASDAKGRILHNLIEAGCALLTAHTNADSARAGVSDALAQALGVTATRPLEPASGREFDKLHVFVPEVNAQALLDALAAAGAGTIGDYERCAFLAAGTGTFRPLPGADPHVGTVGEVEEVAEVRLETVLPRARREAVIAAMRAAHPYEEPAFDIIELAPMDSDLGIGRVGELTAPMTLAEFAQRVAVSLPATAVGIRIGGNLDRTVLTVAVCGGSGDSLLAAANAAGADVYVTADLKHHRVLDHLADGGCAVIDAGHWATEFPWCGMVADLLRDRFADAGDTVAVEVCDLVTDPWQRHLDSAAPAVAGSVDPEANGGASR